MPEADITGKIIIHNTEGIHLLYASDITHCKADDNYCTIYTVDKKQWFVTKNLKMVEFQLHCEDFYRCHKSTLVNIQYIGDFFFLTRKIKLLDGTSLGVSCRNVEYLIKLLKTRTSLYL